MLAAHKILDIPWWQIDKDDIRQQTIAEYTQYLYNIHLSSARYKKLSKQINSELVSENLVSTVNWGKNSLLFAKNCKCFFFNI